MLLDRNNFFNNLICVDEWNAKEIYPVLNLSDHVCNRGCILSIPGFLFAQRS